MGQERELQEILCDPTSARVSLPIRHTLYPLGFPLEIATNSPAVIEAARESWGTFTREFERLPVRVRVLVEDGGSDPAPEPVYRSHRELLLIVSDRGNFGCCDLRSRFGWCHIAANMLADRGWFRWFFLEAMVYVLLNQDEVVSVHAACVARNGRGVLLCAHPGRARAVWHSPARKLAGPMSPTTPLFCSRVRTTAKCSASHTSSASVPRRWSYFPG